MKLNGKDQFLLFLKGDNGNNNFDYELVWENDSPTTKRSAFEISIDKEYKAYFVIFRYQALNAAKFKDVEIVSSHIVLPNIPQECHMMYGLANTNIGGLWVGRIVYFNGQTVSFSTAVRQDSSSQSHMKTYEYEDYMIPVQIYGIK